MASSADVEERAADRLEIEHLLSLSRRRAVREALQQLLSSLPPLPQRATATNAAEAPAEVVEGAPAADASREPQSTERYSEIERYSWTETSSDVQFYLTLPLPPPNPPPTETIRVAVPAPNTVRVEIPSPLRKALTLKPLKGAVQHKGYRLTLKPPNTLSLRMKKVKSELWHELLERPSAFGSSKDDKSKKEEAEDPGASLMQMMKRMYDDGDDEMRRMIAKSWTESREKQQRGEMGLGD